MTTLDRYILRGLVANYLIAITVMISLYVVLDLFFNMDEFTETEGEVLRNMASFYGTRIYLYFAQLSGVITLFACLITLARMRRQNELTAVLASGVSLYRLAAPVVAFALLTSILWYVDSEVIIPRIAHKLARRHDDAQGERTFRVRFLRAANDDLLSADQYRPKDQLCAGWPCCGADPTANCSAFSKPNRPRGNPIHANRARGGGGWNAGSNDGEGRSVASWPRATRIECWWTTTKPISIRRPSRCAKPPAGCATSAPAD
jgi:hypothetical protein